MNFELFPKRDRALLIQQRQLLDDPPRHVLNRDLLFLQLGQLSVPTADEQIEAIDDLATGQADALSKGIKLATGDIVGWINSDDYYEQGIFESVAKHFEDPKTMWVIGNLSYVYDSTQEVIADVSPQVTYQRLVSDPEQRLRGLRLCALAGDEAAYRGFLSALGAHLRAFLRRRLARLPDEVEDLVQETLLAVHNQRHTYQPNRPLTAWVHAIARYKLVDFLRRRAGREATHEPLRDEEGDVFAATDTQAAEARRDIAAMLDGLPDRYRLPIVHVKIEGLSVAETSRLTGMSESAVKVGVHRGLKALAKRVRGDA